MKKTIMTTAAAFMVMGSLMASVEEAGAAVCARGIRRAGCVGPRGAVVRRAPVACRWVWINGVRVRRCI